MIYFIDLAFSISFAFVLILHDTSKRVKISYPKLFLSSARFLASPFREFLHLEDLEETRFGIPHVETPKWKTRIILCYSMTQCFLYSGLFVYYTSISSNITALASAIDSLAWCYLSTHLWNYSPITPPYLILLFNLAQAIFSIFKMISLKIEDMFLLSIYAIIFFVQIFLIHIFGTLPLKDKLPGPDVASSEDVATNMCSCPEDSITLWEWCTFSFIEPILSAAKLHRLDDQDVWTLSPYFKHKNIFEKYLKYRSRHPTYSLLHFLLVSNSLDLILDVLLEFWVAVMGFVPPYALQRILSVLQEPNNSSRIEAYIFTFITFLVHLSFAQSKLYQNWYTRRCYERTRGQLFCALHYKALKRRDISGKISNEEDDTGNADLGKVVNLMQGDVYAVANRFWQFSAFFAAPIKLTIALVFLYKVIGWSSLAGVAVVLTAYALNYPLAKYNIYITRSSWKAKDQRMNGVNELFQNIRFLKFYGWENHWASKVRKYRTTELEWRVKENIIATLISFIWTWVPSATAFFSFLCYTLIAGNQLTVSKTFTALALFHQLEEPMTALPTQFLALLHAYVSMQRIEAFLNEDEVAEWASSLTCPATKVDNEEIGFKHASFTWAPSSNDIESRRCFVLGPLDVEFPKGELTLVTGATGSGKSALLAALLGEMYCSTGNVMLSKSRHEVAFCGQTPWLEHGTIRQNILFASSRGFDEARYTAVIDSCALKRDLDVLDVGDQTEIGEKGVTLSGGQRARIALARAIYSDATCILLDDPLAAVDMHTAQHIVHSCLCGSLVTGRTIILVTHHLSLCLPVASYVVELARGMIVRQGTVAALRLSGQLEQVLTDEDTPLNSNGISEISMDKADVSVNPLPDAAKSGKLITAEARAEGRVSSDTYLTYVKAAGLSLWALTLLLILLMTLLNIMTDFFLAKWGKAYEHSSMLKIMTTFSFFKTSIIDYLPPPDYDVKPWLWIYLVISMINAIVVLIYIGLGYYASLRASKSLFIGMLLRLVRAPCRFFDTTPMGRILNRFTSDINTVDDALQQSARAALSGIIMFLSSFIVIIAIIPSFAPFAVLIAWLYIRLAPAYVRASRDLRRLESVSLSPAFAGFDELLRGISHIRAFAVEQQYQDRFYKRVDTFQAYDHVYVSPHNVIHWLVAGWLRWRYDCLGSIVVLLSTLFALISNIGDDFAAVVIVRAGIFAEASRQLVKVAAQLELDFNSVERIGEYLVVPQEAPAIVEGQRPPAWWPSNSGSLIVENLIVRYASNLPPVLKGISFIVGPCEKIGVVGRTGSGKSTLASALLRILEPSSGKIILDNIDISTIGLEDLRTRITIVSQDVSLFSGNIRSNLDPFGEYSDSECWEVLRRCDMVTSRSGIRSLDSPVSSTGSFSAGERQLLALARAILRGTQVIIMDEATSQIDNALDDQIQATIRQELSQALIITIAHRLKTILDYDRILVLDNGQILEFDSPRQLLRKQEGAFREMCRRSADWDELQKLVGIHDNAP